MIRFGIAGFGLHAVRRLMPGFALAQNCKAVALSRRDPQKARESGKQYGIPHVFTSTEDMCRCPEVDAVLVTSPDVCHLSDVLACVKARKPVLCEKPMAMNADECRQMVEAAENAGVLLGVAHVFRFEESTALLRQRVAAGDIGRVVLARAEFSYPGWEHARTWLYDRAIAAGGPIADVGVHCIDTLRYILQDDPVRVTAVGRSDTQSGNVEAVGILSLEFCRGTLASVLVSTRAQYRSPVEFVGDKGFLRADNGLTVDSPVSVELWRDQKLVESKSVLNDLAYAKQVDAFAEAIEGSKKFPASGRDGWQNQIALDAAYRSMTSGQSEEMPLVTSERNVRTK
jgi:predicted dehydrogenase